MEKIPSFTVDHLRLQTGLYVSRKDYVGTHCLTSFDLRFTRPNYEPVIDNAALHTIEHLGATYLRNEKNWGEKIIYFGPMGCRTGFYLILSGDYKPEDIIELLRGMVDFIINFAGKIPGAEAKDCGNFLEMNLSMAKYYTQKYFDEVLKKPSPERLEYPL